MENTEQLKVKYVEFLDEVKKVYPKRAQQLSSLIENINNEEMMDIIKKYINGVNFSKKYQRQLLDRKDKMFRRSVHPEYISVIPAINMKKVLIKCDDASRQCIWEYLQQLYVLGTNKPDEYCKLLTNRMTSKFVDGDDAFADMVLDISRFVVKKMKSSKDMHPLAHVTSIMKLVYTKYQDKLKGKLGDINSTSDVLKLVKNVLKRVQKKHVIQNADMDKINKFIDMFGGGDMNIGSIMTSLNDVIKNNNGKIDIRLILNKINETGLMEKLKMFGIKDINTILTDDMIDKLNMLVNSINLKDDDGNMDISKILGSFGGEETVENNAPLTEEQIREMEEFYLKMSETRSALNNKKY
ncbi:MAG: hypothetical protein Faunusvirus12_10 [Faunusvirus sp.]|jgi:hypothetical protein|uniref:Uncharacterized protein n=1 Tax=Faunusvirus sp. TaxID=2487766 RepID=A0A3G4ZWW5_9VIRU|nr:MAG: hypothetical protein Faunusvirus12_10 [Faunusvirus sp.]